MNDEYWIMKNEKNENPPSYENRFSFLAERVELYYKWSRTFLYKWNIATQYEIILTDCEIFCFAESEMKFVPSYAVGIFYICKANISHRRYFTRSVRNEFHWKKHAFACFFLAQKERLELLKCNRKTTEYQWFLDYWLARWLASCDFDCKKLFSFSMSVCAFSRDKCV